MNRYEEASKELEKLRSMNRYLSSSIRDHNYSSTKKAKSPEKRRHFLSELDEDYEERRNTSRNSYSQLKDRKTDLRESSHSRLNGNHSDYLDEAPSFLSSDIPNLSISRLHDSGYKRNNVSFGNKSSYSSSFLDNNTRHLSALDLDEKPNIQTTSYSKRQYSSNIGATQNSSSSEGEGATTRESAARSLSPTHHRSTQTASDSNKNNIFGSSTFDSSFSSTHPTFTTPSTTPFTSSTSVIAAFRELQNKIKSIENERYLLYQEKDELKNRLLEMKRHTSLTKNKLEIETTESLLSLRNVYDKMKKTYHDLSYQLLSKQDINETYKKKIQTQESLYSSLQHDNIKLQEKLLVMEKNKLALERKSSEMKYRINDIEYQYKQSPTKHSKYELPKLNEINELENEISNVHYENQKITMKIHSLQTYIDTILKINGDLCDTLIDREKAKNNFLKSLSPPPPRYTWPKEIPYNNILAVVNEATKAQATAALENSAYKATEQVMKSVIESISPSKSPAKRGGSSYTSSVSPSRSSMVSRSLSPSFRYATKGRSQSPYRYEHNSSDVGDIPVYNSPERIEDRLHKSLNKLSSPEGKLESDEEEEDFFDDNNDDNNMYHSSSKGVSFDKHISERNHGKLLNLSDSEDEDDIRQSSSIQETKKIKRVKRKKTKKVGTRRRSLSAGSTSTGGERRSRSSSLTRHKSSTLEKVITRQGAINSATRFAAALNAAVHTVKVGTTPSAVRTSHHRANKMPMEAKADFIPSSGTRSSEFNVIASVSKASRAVKELNASLASK
jgi:hypothetical protein